MQVFQLAKERGIAPGEMVRTLRSKGIKAYNFSKVSDEMIAAIDASDKIKPSVVEVSSNGNMTFKHEDDANGTRYYYAKSERLTLGGFIPEKRGLGYIEPDRSIQFENHLYVTADEKEQSFIEGCQRFSIGDISLTNQEGYSQTMQQLADRRNRMKEEAARTSGISR